MLDAMDDDTTHDDETRTGIDAPADDAFTDHFTSPIYDDAGDEFAPFGTDEGADLLADWAARTDELGPTTTVRDLLADGLDDPADVDGMLAELDDEDGVDAATVVVGAGFTLLRLTGTPVRVLYKVVLLETVLPLLSATVLAAAVGYTVALPVTHALAPNSHTTPMPGGSYYLILGSGVVLALAVLLSCLPILNRITVTDNVRFE